MHISMLSDIFVLPEAQGRERCCMRTWQIHKLHKANYAWHCKTFRDLQVEAELLWE